MRTPISSKQFGLAAACALALGMMSATAYAQEMPYSNAYDHSLLRDGSGRIVMSQYGECWHTGQGPRPESTQRCDPNWRAPQPVAQYVAPAPAPIAAPYVAPIVVAAVAPVYERVSFDTNVLFDFDKADLRPAGRAKLDEFISKTWNLVQPGSMIAVGHADRIGTDGYNQKLSEERVATVKDYLISKGVSASVVNSSGRGESQPTTRGECTGAATASNIACLQPDRHVFIEMSGQQLVK
jgi:OOP family OmpA-OmpF porin